MKRPFVLCLIFLVLGSCATKEAEGPVELEELRVHRWTALEGGEILIIRRVGSEWSAELLGDGARFRCFYVKKVTPRSDWNALWGSFVQEGLTELSGSEPSSGWEDGEGFDVELRSHGQTQRYSVDNPTHQSSENSKRILRIGNLISKEFDTPLFAETHDRGQVAEYLYSPCGKD